MRNIILYSYHVTIFITLYLLCKFPFTSFYLYFWRRKWQPTPVFLLGVSHGQRSLVGCNPWGREELDMTVTSLSLFCIGGGNGNPLQCSCLENPRDGVTQSRTRLKWFSTSSSNGAPGFYKLIHIHTGTSLKSIRNVGKP